MHPNDSVSSVHNFRDVSLSVSHNFRTPFEHSITSTGFSTYNNQVRFFFTLDFGFIFTLYIQKSFHFHIGSLTRSYRISFILTTFSPPSGLHEGLHPIFESLSTQADAC
jgi:hypothetical protein